MYVCIFTLYVYISDEPADLPTQTRQGDTLDPPLDPERLWLNPPLAPSLGSG